MSDKKELSDYEKHLEFIQKSMKQKHETQQVCLEVLRCLSRSDLSPLIIKHCKGELNRVLLDEGVYLH